MDIRIALYPIIAVQSRYGGTYEGGEWHALPNADAAWMWSEGYSDYMFGGDEEAIDFWQSADAEKLGRGETPNAAVLDLIERHARMGQWDYDNAEETERETQEGSRTEDGEAPATPSGLLP